MLRKNGIFNFQFSIFKQIPMTKIQKIQTTLVFGLLFVAAIPVFAAEISFDSKIQEIGVGSQFEVNVFLNPEGEDINAIEGRIIFPEKIIELKEIKDGNSIVNFWIERPEINNGEILFSGIIPGGYIGNKGLIFSAVFYAKKQGKGFIEIREPKILLNDGQGTETKTEASVLEIAISPKAPSVLPLTKKDIEPPEDFLPEIASDQSVFEGKWFLVFATQDKVSGIGHYEVCEGKRKCVVAESPYLLENQNLDDEIVVKAIDKSGNERIVTLPAQKPAVWYKNYLILAIIILVIAVAYFIWRILWKKRKKRNF